MASLFSAFSSAAAGSSSTAAGSSPPSYTRRAQHAGSWYSSSSSALRAQFEGWLEKVSSSKLPPASTTLGIVSPHAGYRYSGPTAAFGFSAIEAALKENKDISRVFVLGPSHEFSLSGVGVSGASTLETPIANLPVDTDVTASINAALSKSRASRFLSKSEDENEHSLEMQLPFLAHCINSSGRGEKEKEKEDEEKVKVVPLLVGSLPSSSLDAIAHCLLPHLVGGKSLFVISSDFCHWGERFDYQPFAEASSREGKPICRCIEAMDREGMRLIESCSHSGFTSYLRETDNTICGRNPIALFLRMVELANTASGGAAAGSGSGAGAGSADGGSGGTSKRDMRIRMRFLDYSQSNAIKDDETDSSVSYTSAVVFRGEESDDAIVA